MYIEFFILLFLMLIVYLLCSRHRTMSIRGKMSLTGPPTNIILGNAAQIGLFMHKNGPKMAWLMQEWTETYGKIFGFYIGPLYFVMISDLELVKDVLIKQFNCFTDRMEMYLIRKALKDSIITLKGQKWKEIRQTVTPICSKNRLKQMTLVVEEKLDIFMKIMANQANSGKTFDIYSNFKALTLDVIGKVAFAMDVNCQKDLNDPFFVNVSKFFKEQHSTENSILFKLAALFPELSSFLNVLMGLTESVQAENWLFSSLAKVIEQRVSRSEFKSIDVLQLLLEQSIYANKSDKKILNLSHDQIGSNCFVFLLAGYETTSTALGFSAWLLAKHPEVQSKLQQEIDQFITSEADIEYDLVQKLPYLDAVYHESLRMYPPVVLFVSRTCTKECYVGNTKFEPGVQVMIPVYTIHRDPDIWPQPNQFIPERFYKNNDYHPMAWLPYGGGPRNCVGTRFAEIEYKLTITRLLYKYKLQFGSGSQDPLPIVNHHALLDPHQVFIEIVERKENNDFRIFTDSNERLTAEVEKN